MSAFKWERLYQIAMLHDVIPYAYQGITNCRPQFFMRLTDKQELTWKRANEEITAHQTEEEEDTFLRADTLTNPVLNSQLQNILDDEHSDMTTRQVLLQLIRVVRHILNEGMPIHQLLELGLLLHQHGKKVDFDQLRQWIKKLRLTQMCQLEGECLILLFGFHAEDLPFMRRICRLSLIIRANAPHRSPRNCWSSPTPVPTTGISHRMPIVSLCITATLRRCSVTCAVQAVISVTILPRDLPISSRHLCTLFLISRNSIRIGSAALDMHMLESDIP